MNSQPQITTIIPTFNRQKLIKRAIRSVLNQTYPNIQVCIYDNASQDGTCELVAEMANNDPRIKYHRHQENIGATANFNYGMSKVETPFFSLLSDDDLLLPDFYKTALGGFQRYPKAVFSACEVIEMTEDGEFLRTRLSRWPREGYYHPPESLLEMLGKEPVWTGILFRRDVLKNVGYLDPEAGLPSDVDFQIRIASEFPIVVSRQPGALFIDHSSSTSSSTYINTYLNDWLRMINKLKENEKIPMDVRLQGGHKLEKQLIGFLFRTRAVTGRDFGSAYESVEILRNVFHQRLRANLLYLVTFLCEKIPPLCNLLLFTRYLYRKIISRMKSNYSRKNLECFAKYLTDEV